MVNWGKHVKWKPFVGAAVFACCCAGFAWPPLGWAVAAPLAGADAALAGWAGALAEADLGVADALVAVAVALGADPLEAAAAVAAGFLPPPDAEEGFLPPPPSFFPLAT